MTRSVFRIASVKAFNSVAEYIMPVGLQGLFRTMALAPLAAARICGGVILKFASGPAGRKTGSPPARRTCST